MFFRVHLSVLLPFENADLDVQTINSTLLFLWPEPLLILHNVGI